MSKRKYFRSRILKFTLVSDWLHDKENIHWVMLEKKNYFLHLIPNLSVLFMYIFNSNGGTVQLPFKRTVKQCYFVSRLLFPPAPTPIPPPCPVQCWIPHNPYYMRKKLLFKLHIETGEDRKVKSRVNFGIFPRLFSTIVGNISIDCFVKCHFHYSSELQKKPLAIGY